MGSFFSVIFLIALTAVGLFIGVFGVAYLYLSVFVNLMHYDFVTSSSIYFSIIVTSLLLNFIALLFVKKENRKQSPAVYFFVFVFLYPLLLSASVNVFEAWSKPEISTALNAVAIYRHYVSLPVVYLLQIISSIGSFISHFAPGSVMVDLTKALSPYFTKAINSFLFVEGHPLLRGLALVIITAILSPIDLKKMLGLQAAKEVAIE